MILDNFTEEAEVPEIVQLREDAPTMEALRRRFTVYESSTDEHRSKAFQDRGYYDGDAQIGSVWREHFSKMNLPPIYDNQIRPIVNGHVGILLGQQTDPQAYPRSDKDVEAAAVATKILRYVSDKTKWKQKKIDACMEKFVEGIGAVLVECSEREVFIDRISFRDFIYDPFSREPDFSDASWLGFAKWVTADDVRQTWPEAYERLGRPDDKDFMTVGGVGFKDSPSTWVDKDTKRLQVITMYFREKGRWQYVVWCHAGVLDFDDCPYEDGDGRSVCPLIPMSCYVSGDPDGQNARYGIVRDMIMPQNEYNAHRAQALLYATSRKVQQVDKDAEITDIELVRKEAARPDAVLQPGWQYLPDNGMQQHLGFMQLAQGELQKKGPTPAVLGRSLGASESGRSRQVQAAAGLTEIAILLDRIERFEDSVFRMIWNQVRQFWTEEMFIRVTGRDRSAEFVKINAPIVEGMKQQYVVGEDGMPVAGPDGQPQVETVPNITGYENEVAQMDMDIVVATVQENVNLEHETWQEILQFCGSTGILPGDPRFLMMLHIAPLTNKTEIIEKFEGLMKKQQEDGAEQAQQEEKLKSIALQLDTETKTSEIEKTKAGAAKLAAEAQKLGVEAHAQTNEEVMRQMLMQSLGNISGV